MYNVNFHFHFRKLLNRGFQVVRKSMYLLDMNIDSLLSKKVIIRHEKSVESLWEKWTVKVNLKILRKLLNGTELFMLETSINKLLAFERTMLRGTIRRVSFGNDCWMEIGINEENLSAIHWAISDSQVLSYISVLLEMYFVFNGFCNHFYEREGLPFSVVFNYVSNMIVPFYLFRLLILNRFCLREIKLFKSFNNFGDNLHIALIFEYMTSGLVFIVKRFWVFKICRTKFISLQFLQGVEYLHYAYILLRNLKPNNLILIKTGVFKNDEIELLSLLGPDGTISTVFMATSLTFISPCRFNPVKKGKVNSHHSSNCTLHRALGGQVLLVGYLTYVMGGHRGTTSLEGTMCPHNIKHTERFKAPRGVRERMEAGDYTSMKPLNSLTILIQNCMKILQTTPHQHMKAQRPTAT